MNQRSDRGRRRIVTLIKALLGLLVVGGVSVSIYRVRQPVTIDWEPAEGPARTIVWALALDPTDPGTIYVGTNGGGVYESSDGGTTWAQKNEGLTSLQGRQKGIEHARDVRDILISRTRPGAMYVATHGEGVYCSDVDGANWNPQFMDVLATGDAELLNESAHVRVLAETETDIFAGTNGGVFRLIAPDAGLWQLTSLKGEDVPVRALVVDPRDSRTLYAATLGQGIYRSVDDGETWERKNEGLESDVAQKVNALILDSADPDVMYAGSFGDGVYRSLDGGESWESWSEGLPASADIWSLHFSADGTLFAGLRYGGTYKRGASEKWEPANFPYGALALEVDPRTDAIYAGTWGGGLYRDEKGRDESRPSWQNLGLPQEYLRLRAAVFVSSTLYVGTHADGIYASQDEGQSWERRSGGLEGSALTVWTLAVGPDGHTLYAGTGGGVFASSDYGEQWTPLGKDTLPSSDFSVVSLAVHGDEGGQDDVYAGTRQGLWVFDGGQQTWTGRVPFEPEDIVWVPSLLVEDGVVYASTWGWGIQRSFDLGKTWRQVEMAPKYVETLALADKTWLQWGGKQLYALTERGLYGSRDGASWGSLDPVSPEALTIDPLHPQVAYASLTRRPESNEALDAASSITTTAILASRNDGRDWDVTYAQDGDLAEDATLIKSPVAHLVRDPADSRRLFALTADGGMYRGRVRLPWLVREVVVGWLLAIASFLVLVAAPYSYFNLVRDYGLSHRLAWGLLARFWLLFRVRSQRFQNRLKPTGKLILAIMDQPHFGLVEVWERLDQIGVSTSRSRLMSALKDLVGRGLLKEREGDYYYAAPGLQNVATVELQESEDVLIEGVRRENRLLNDVERFFEEAGFDVRQGAPRHLTKFILRPRRSLYRDYRQLYTWLRFRGPLQGDEVNVVCQEAAQSYGPSSEEIPPGKPFAFVVVTEIPEVEAFRQASIWGEQIRLITLSTTTIRSALRERSAIRDLDVLVQQERSRADLYDIRTPAVDRLDFFGRRDTIARLKGELREGRSVDVWSLPGMGKTSLLWHLKEALLNPIVAYADLEYGWQGEPSFHEQIVGDLASDLWLKYDRFLDERTGDFEERMLSIAQAVPVRGERTTQVVLLLDGASETNDGDGQQRALERIRRLADARPNLALVVTWRDPEPAAAPWTVLGGLDERESAQLITTIGIQMGLTFSQSSLVHVYRETGGHPLLLRQLGSAIARRVPIRSPAEFRKVTPVGVDQALPDYRAVRDRYFEDVWRWHSPDQRERLRAWSATSKEGREHVPDAHPHLRALTRPGETLGDLFATWMLSAVEENRL